MIVANTFLTNVSVYDYSITKPFKPDENLFNYLLTFLRSCRYVAESAMKH